MHLIPGAIVSGVGENQHERPIVIMCDDLADGDLCRSDSESVIWSDNADGGDVSGSDRERSVASDDEVSPNVSCTT